LRVNEQDKARLAQYMAGKDLGVRRSAT
jgi:hypothetical protein